MDCWPSEGTCFGAECAHAAEWHSSSSCLPHFIFCGMAVLWSILGAGFLVDRGLLLKSHDGSLHPVPSTTSEIAQGVVKFMCLLQSF